MDILFEEVPVPDVHGPPLSLSFHEALFRRESHGSTHPLEVTALPWPVRGSRRIRSAWQWLPHNITDTNHLFAGRISAWAERGHVAKDNAIPRGEGGGRCQEVGGAEGLLVTARRGEQPLLERLQEERVVDVK